MIRPQDVLYQYLGANTIQERRESLHIFHNTNHSDICQIAIEMGYDRFDCGPNSVWHEYMHEYRMTLPGGDCQPSWLLSNNFSINSL